MIRSVAVILLCFLFILTAEGQSKKSKKVLPVFSVNKKTVTADEFIYLYKKNHQNKPEEFTKDKIQEYLDLFINFKLKVEEARRRGLDTTEAFKKEYSSYKDELRKPYLPDNKLSDSLARLTYERMKEEVKASHILINVKPDASPQDTLEAYRKISEIRKKSLAGEDFGELAIQFSQDPSAKSNKGLLGYFTALQMVYNFENAAYSIKPGEVSQPVRTRFGYHLVKVEDRRPTRGEVEVSHIMIRTGEEKEANEKARNTIFEISDQLRAGVKWEELVREYSDDTGSKDNGGKLKPFGIGAMPSLPTFEQAAFSLQKPGETSDPFQTQYGWHIVRLENKIPMQSYDEMAASLKAKVNRDERTQISKQNLQLKLRKDFAFREFETVKSKVLALADTSLRRGKFKAPPLFSNSEVLFSLQNKSVLTKEFLSYVQKNQRPNSQAPDKYFETLYNNFVEANINELLEERIMRQNPDFQMLLNEYYEGILLFDIMEKEVWNKASEDSVGQEKYFLENKTKYVAGERAKTILFTASKELIDQLSNKIAAGDTVKLDDFVSANKIRKETGSFEKSEKSILNKVSWAKGVYPAENGGMYYLVWIKDILPPGQKTFQEARPAVISDYQGYLEKSWIETLKKKYPVKLNEKGKKYVFSKLQTAK